MGLNAFLTCLMLARYKLCIYHLETTN